MLKINAMSADKCLVVESDGSDPIFFNIRSYEQLSNQSVLRSNVFDLVNRFFETLTDEQRRDLANFYRSSAQIIKREYGDSLDATVSLLQREFYDGFIANDVFNHLVDFCESDALIYPDLSYVEDDHHKANKSFFLEDYKALTAMALLSQIMVPVWGSASTAFMVSALDDHPRLKKILSIKAKALFGIIAPYLMNDRVGKTYRKLISITDMVCDAELMRLQEYKRRPLILLSVKETLKANRTNVDDIHLIVLATLFVKRFSGYEALPQNGEVPNIAAFIANGTKRATEIKLGTMDFHLRATLSGDDVGRIDPDALFFTEESIEDGAKPLVRAVRSFFVDKKITNRDYIKRYQASFAGKDPAETKQTAILKMAADRKFIMNPDRVTPKMTTMVIQAMGYDVVELERSDSEAKLVVRDRQSGEESVYRSSVK